MQRAELGQPPGTPCKHVAACLVGTVELLQATRVPVDELWTESISNGSWWKKDRNFPFTKLEAHATTLYDSVFVGEETQTQHYGWATCENIRVCNRLNGQGVMALRFEMRRG